MAMANPLGSAPEADAALIAMGNSRMAAALFVISSDLSHYHGYDEARKLDARTSRRILSRDDHLDGEEACGAAAINGLMLLARDHDLTVTELDVRNSGDTAGDRQQVVGYGAYAIH